MNINLYLFYINFIIFNNLNLNCREKYNKNCYKKNDFNKNNNENDDNNENDKKKDKEDNNKNSDEIFEKCLNFKNNDFNFPKQYKPINSGFEWKNNNCWLISYIELYLNDPKNQEFLRNTNFDKNNEDDRKYIVLRDILKLLSNDEGNYKLDFTKYHDFFWSELERTKNIGKEGKKKYDFNDSCIVYKLLDCGKTLCIDDNYFKKNQNIKKILKKNDDEIDLKIVNKLVYEIYLNNNFYTFLLQKIFGQKFKDYLVKYKDNLIKKDDNNDYILNNNFLFEDSDYFMKLLISYQNKNVENEIKKIKEKIENNNKQNISTDIENELKNYKIEVNSILFHGIDFHFFTFVHDINNNKWINLNSLNKKENGKIYNPIDNLDNNLEIIQENDDYKYFPVFISITISKKNRDNNCRFDIQRFIEAQKNDYNIALKEVKNGKKESHWIWYIFPQIDGLGISEMNKKYSIKSIEEGLEYLKNDILRTNLLEITKALLEYYKKDKVKKIKEIFDDPDNLKLQSSMTLFNYIVEKYKDSELKEIYNEFLDENNKILFKEVLDIYFDNQQCKESLKIIKNSENNYFTKNKKIFN